MFLLSCSQTNEPSLYDADIFVLFNSSSDLFISNIDGSIKQNLTNTPILNESEFDVSAITSKIIFKRNGYSNDELCVMDLNGDNLIVILSTIKGIGSPKFSNDGNYIIFVSSIDGHAQIYKCKLDGTELKNISNNKYSDHSPQFGFNDQKIIYYSSREPENGLFKMNSDGSDQSFIVSTNQQGTKFSLSPNGEQIAYCNLMNEYRSDIFVTDYNGNNIKQITSYDGWDDSPIFSYDGEKIIYISNPIIENRPNGDIKVFNLHNDTSEYIIKNIGSCYQQSISKNYRYLAFGNSGDLYIYSMVEKTNINITNNGKGYYNPIIFEVN